MAIHLAGSPADVNAAVETGLLFLYDMTIRVVQNGLGVFRQALTLKVLPEAANRQYTKGDYEPWPLLNIYWYPAGTRILFFFPTIAGLFLQGLLCFFGPPPGS